MSSSNGENLIRQIQLERLVSGIAKDFIHNEKIEDSIRNALKKIGEISNASRAYVFEIHSNNELISNSYEWCNTNVVPAINNLQNLPASTYPMWMKWLSQGKILNISNVDEMPKEASAEKSIIKKQGIKSLLVLPLSYDTGLKGFVGFDNCEKYNVWQDEDEVLLAILSEIFSSAFERKQKEKQLQQTNEQLNETINELNSLQSQLFIQEQMAAIGNLAAGIAHEINNPLGFILSNTTTLKDYVNEILEEMKSCNITNENIIFISSDIKDLVSDTLEGLDHVKKIVDSLRYFSRANTNVEFNNYNIIEGLENSLTMLNNRIKYLCKVEKHIADNIPMICADSGRINQVILNLLVNALDAIEEKNIQGRGMISIDISFDRKNLIFSISDNGIGIEKETINNIFKPFFTTKSLGKGTGFGLSIVYEIIVNLHKGKIDVESTPNIGTKFILNIPINI